jgi:RES domain-containing protein
MSEISAWRIEKSKWAAEAFSGEGSAAWGGRWNSPGSRVVYVSRNLSMAVLEKLVHLEDPRLAIGGFVKFSIRFGEIPIARIPLDSLPQDWPSRIEGRATQEVGDRWLAENKTAILALPSVILPEEENYLLNPAHSDFKRIVISRPAPFRFDPRLDP